MKDKTEKSEAKSPERGLVQVQEHSIVPRTMDELMKFAEILAKSDFVPKDYQGKPGNCLVAMMMGCEVGLKHLQAIQNIAVINGRPTIWGDAALALVMGSGRLKEFNEDPPDVALKQGFGRCFVWRRGDPKGTEYKFTQEMAKTAGLWGKQGPWSTTPGRMMQLRARGFGLRDKAPDVLKGLSLREEVLDYVEECRVDDKTTVVKPQRKTTDEAKSIEPTNQEGAEGTGDGDSNVTLIEKVTQSAFGKNILHVWIGGKKYCTEDIALAKKCKEWAENKIPIEFSTDEKGGAIVEIGPSQEKVPA